MSQRQSATWTDVKPFVSVFLTIATLFAIVFLKMEVRRMGYAVLKSSRELKKIEDEQRLLQIRIARALRPQRVRGLAEKKFTLRQARGGRLIQLSGDRVALRQ